MDPYIDRVSDYIYNHIPEFSIFNVTVGLIVTAGVVAYFYTESLDPYLGPESSLIKGAKVAIIYITKALLGESSDPNTTGGDLDDNKSDSTETSTESTVTKAEDSKDPEDPEEDPEDPEDPVAEPITPSESTRPNSPSESSSVSGSSSDTASNASSSTIVQRRKKGSIPTIIVTESTNTTASSDTVTVNRYNALDAMSSLSDNSTGDTSSSSMPVSQNKPSLSPGRSSLIDMVTPMRTSFFPGHKYKPLTPITLAQLDSLQEDNSEGSSTPTQADSASGNKESSIDNPSSGEVT
jgi:hypothetical protein